MGKFDSPARRAFEQAARSFSEFNRRYRPTRVPSWGIPEVAALSALTYAGIWFLEKGGLTLEIVEALRKNYFVFTREPLLQLYTYIALETFIIKLGVTALVILTLRLRRDPVLEALGLKSAGLLAAGRLLPAFFIFSLAAAFFQGFDPLISNKPTHLFFEESAAIGNALAFFSLMVAAPAAEEIFFRGFAYPVFAARWNASVSIGVTSLLFTAVHIPQMKEEWLWLGVIFTGGLMIGAARAVSGSTAVAIFFHALYNAVITAVGLAKVWIYGY